MPDLLSSSHRSLDPASRVRSLLTLAFLLLAASLLRVFAQPVTSPEVIAYVFPTRPEGRLLKASEIDAAKLTRINYAFALINAGRVVEGASNDVANLRLLRSLKTGYPRLKVVVSVGGWLGSGGFSDAALTPGSRRVFIDSALAFINRYDLDGLDLDWEYPGQAGAGNTFRPEDGANFNLMLQGLRARFDAQTRRTHKPLLLSIAAGSSLPYLEHTNMGQAQRYLDQVNLMTYDFYEPGSGKPAPTGNHAPLFADPADPHAASSAAMVQAFLEAGVPPSKLVLGVPFYGHAWAEVPAANHGLFQTGVAAPNLPTDYDAIQVLLTRGFTRYWDAAAQVPYAYNETTQQFISYEDAESLRRKCAYLRDQHLGGIMFWQLFSDTSGTLLATLHTALSTAAPVTTTSVPEARP